MSDDVVNTDRRANHPVFLTASFILLWSVGRDCEAQKHKKQQKNSTISPRD